MTGPLIFTPEYYARMRALENDGWWSAAMRDVAALLLAQLALPRDGRLLDIGCGSGQTMAWFRTLFPGWQTFGLDIAFDGLRAARTLGETQVLAASAMDLPVPTGSVDAVISLDVLQHLPLRGGDELALREIRRVLRPGGAVLLRTNAQSIPYAADDEAFAFHKYETDEMRAKLQSAGLIPVRIGRVNALLGLAEIRRELRARRHTHGHYVGLLATPSNRQSMGWKLKRRWLRMEGAAVAHGWSLPLGRTIFALAQTPSEQDGAA